jgi:4-hydroxy-tetrahydrodipicolinate reductase
MSLRLVVSGATGRMGKAILELAARDPFFALVGALETPQHANLGKPLSSLSPALPGKVFLRSRLSEISPAPQVLIDFTQPPATLAYLKEAVELKAAMVIGTTGFSDGEKAEIQKAALSIPIVQASNMSMGMNLLFSLVREAALKLGQTYDVEIVEAHHHHKKDAPSGTALTLGESVAKAWGVPLKDVSTHGREGLVGERKAGTIGFHAVRGGDIVGDHTVFFAGPGERLELTHRAQSREPLAQGALRAARFLADKSKGYFDMKAVLGLDGASKP